MIQVIRFFVVGVGIFKDIKKIGVEGARGLLKDKVLFGVKIFYYFVLGVYIKEFMEQGEGGQYSFFL